MTELLQRECTACGDSLEIKLFESGMYVGGHYFSGLCDEREYWECNACFYGDDDEEVLN